MPAEANAVNAICSNFPTPVERAREHSECDMPDRARCVVTSVEEHAVSSARHGPVRPFRNEILPEATDSRAEVPV